jgi:hypothetical protein
MSLQYTGSGLAGPVCTLVPRRGAPTGVAHEFVCFVDQHEKRHLISRAPLVQIPNAGSVARRAKRDMFDVLPRVGAVGGHFATVS